MPTRARSGNAGKAVAAVVPLAIALVSSAVLPSDSGLRSSPNATDAVKCGDDVEDFRSCHTAYPTGCSTAGNYDPYLNFLKNTISWSSSRIEKVLQAGDYDKLETSLPPQLGKRNHSEYASKLSSIGEGKLYSVVGYLYGIKAEGKESSNCQLDAGDNNENVDFHIWVGFDGQLAAKLRAKEPLGPQDKTALKQQAIIVEMTPHYRDRFRPEWDLSAIRLQLGRQVRVVGQLMVDNEHNVSSQNCGRSDATDACWRLSVWELHPVTQFQLCSKDMCTAQDSNGWFDLGQNITPGSTATSALPRQLARKKP
jgi:hypothetical protein